MLNGRSGDTARHPLISHDAMSPVIHVVAASFAYPPRRRDEMPATLTPTYSDALRSSVIFARERYGEA